MLRSKATIPVILLALAAIAAWYFLSSPEAAPQQESIRYEVQPAPFVIKVTATGELAAKRSVKIQAPAGMRPAGIYETTLSDLVAEGTVVSAGDYVASLDRTELASKMTDARSEIEKIQTQLEQARIDTAIELRGIRDELANLVFAKQGKLLAVEQSKYEPRSVIQQAELDLERTERDYGQVLKKYELKQQQAIAKIQEIDALLRQQQRQLKVYADLSDEMTIYAPEPGMVIYARTWRGKKEPGARISAWDPIVAELPDLSDMISQTYVNEVDISRVQEGQDVKVQVDAFPDRSYTGKVIKVANIGEQLSGYDAKVFEVIVQVNESDSILRPAMTTSNEIITGVYEGLLSVPLEALQSDSLPFVYKATGAGVVRQEIITGLANADQIVVAHGIAAGDVVLLNPPANAEDLPFEPLPAAVKQRVRAQLEKEKAEREKEAMRRKAEVKNIAPPSSNNGGGGGGFIIID
ncbi:efflux RND transporter periplasmic adaptor subunit [Phaeodactylibacter luteus]|nr:HlyD family efflux transporter periplasmic adaptor subunit [Phaeodactylibacter luteus]